MTLHAPRRAVLAAFLWSQVLAPAFAAAGQARSEPVRAVIPVSPARAAGTSSAKLPGSLPRAEAAALPAPAGAAKAAAYWAGEGATSIYAEGQLVQVHALTADAALTAGDAGDVALALKGAGDKVFDMRRDQLAQQWPAVAAELSAAAARPTFTKEELRRSVLAVADALEAARRAAPPAGASAPARGEVRLDAEISGPIAGARLLTELAFSRAADAATMRHSLEGLLAGYDRALRRAAGLPEPAKPVVNDVTQLNPVSVEAVVAPESVEQLAAAVRGHAGAISVGGGRYSMGGQTASEDALQIDMRRMNKVLGFDPVAKELTVQTGIRWRDVQRFIDPHDLSVKIMQTYADFTVGGALSVNAHGRYMGLGPVILSVKKIKVVLADGRVVTASPERNPSLFYAAIGGYGGVGVIAEATLSLADNKALEESISEMPASDYKKFFFENIRNSASAVFHNADLRPPYDHATAVTYFETDKPVTIKERMRPTGGSYRLRRHMTWAITERPWGQMYRRMIDRIRTWLPRPVLWRNYEASYDVMELEPKSRAESTYVLQEYFVPVEKFDEFRGKMAEILNRHKVNALNVSVRHAKRDPGSLLAWAREESFAFVLYHKQLTTEAEKGRVGVWTRELIDAALATGGAYYLPYQLHATHEQFHRAYPRAKEYFELKRKLDPTGKFTNKLWDKYYGEPPAQPAANPASNFKTVYENGALRDAYYKYLQNIFHMYPEDKLHQLIAEETARHATDQEIYEAVQARLKEIKPALQPLRYALPALAVQKKEMADQTRALLGERGRRPINGYLEFGTLGRYVTPLKERLEIKGPVYVVSHEPMSLKPDAIFERGGLRQVGTYVPNKGDPIKPEQVPDASVDLITVYPGLHHFSEKGLEPFVASLWRVLRPGGRLIVRDHDVDSPAFDQFAGLVHDVYNLGVNEPWAVNQKEIRRFTSVKGLEEAMLKRGFRSTGKRGLQANDPTRNTLLEFEKIDKPGEPMELGLHKRKAEMTYLTLPEWYIVYASREYAAAMKGLPSQFDYLGAIAQFWGEYKRALKHAGPKANNADAQIMLLSIGIPHSVEFGVKWLYEKTVGRLFELPGRLTGTTTAEDRYAAKVLQDYVDFIDITPWYRFPYGKALAGLWTLTPFELNLPRKLERRLALTAVYTGKWALATLFTFLVKHVFPPEPQDTLVVARGVADPAPVADLGDGRKAHLLPRYGPFTKAVSELAAQGAEFESVEGNAEISITVLARRGWTPPAGELLSSYDLLNEAEDGEPTQRHQLKVPVARLAELLNALPASGAVLEHVYDF